MALHKPIASPLESTPKVLLNDFSLKLQLTHFRALCVHVYWMFTVDSSNQLTAEGRSWTEVTSQGGIRHFSKFESGTAGSRNSNTSGNCGDKVDARDRVGLLISQFFSTVSGRKTFFLHIQEFCLKSENRKQKVHLLKNLAERGLENLCKSYKYFSFESVRSKASI